MAIKFDYIYLKNFLCYEEEKFVFEDGVFGIIGYNKTIGNNRSNGSGKTAILDAILYCLTGMTFKGLRADDVIRQGSNSCVVKLVFTNLDNQKKGYILVKRKPNKLKFFNGVKNIQANSITELQKKILSFFGVDYDLLTRFILVGEKERHKFSFLGSDDRTIKELLTKLTNSQFIDLVYKKVLEDERVVSDELLVLKTKKENVENDIEKYKQDIEKYQKDYESILKEDKKNLNLVKIEYEKLDSKIKLLEEDYNKIRERYDEEIEKIENELNVLEKDRNDVKNNLEFLHKMMDRNITCPNCGTEFLVDKNLKVVNQEHLLTKIKAQENKLNILEKQLKEIQIREDDIRNKYENKVESKKKILLKNREEFENVKEKYLKYKNSIQLNSKFLKKNVKEFSDKLNLANENLKSLNLEIADKENKLNIIEKYKYYFGKEGLKNFLFSRKLEVIEYYTNQVLLETNNDFQIELSGMKKMKSGKWNKKIDGKIIFSNGMKRNYKSLSKGEQRIIDLAFIEAFSRLFAVKNFTLKVFDEPFSGLDNEAKNNVINMIKNLKDSYNSIYIISPETDLITNNFNENEIYTVIKDDNKSKIYKGIKL